MVDLRRVAIYLGAFTGPLAGNAVLALVPALKQAFDASGPEVLLSITFFMVPFAFIMLFTGTLSDIAGRKKLLVFGFILYATGNFLCSTANQLEFFYLARTISGVGFAFVQPVVQAMLGDIVPENQRGRAMGIFGAATTLGIALGPLLAGFISTVNWRLTFIIISLLALCIMLLTIYAYRASTEAKGRMRAKTLISALGEGLHNRKVVFLSIGGFLTFMCYISTLSFISDQLSLPPLSLASEQIGTITSMAGVAGILAAPAGGLLVDKIGRLRAGAVGYAIMAVAFLLMTRVDSSLTYAAFLAILGSGIAIVWATLLTLSVEVMPEAKGTSTSIFNCLRFFGYAAAPVLFAPIYISLGLDYINITDLAITLLAFFCLYFVILIGRRGG